MHLKKNICRSCKSVDFKLTMKFLEMMKTSALHIQTEPLSVMKKKTESPRK